MYIVGIILLKHYAVVEFVQFKNYEKENILERVRVICLFFLKLKKKGNQISGKFCYITSFFIYTFLIKNLGFINKIYNICVCR